MNKNHLPKLSSKSFQKKLLNRKLENLQLINAIERYLKKERGFVFKMPKPGTSVILLTSGGLDSSVILNLLLSVYKLKVYPLFLDTSGQSIKAKLALKETISFLQKQYPDLLQDLMLFTLAPYPKEIDVLKKQKSYFHQNFLFSMTDFESKKVLDDSVYYPRRVFPYMEIFYCLKYARHLNEHQNIKISTYFSGILPGDGTALATQSFTSLRTAMLSMCSITNSYDQQYISLAFEKELGFWLEKKDLIKIGTELGLPLEKTWSCYNFHKHQCGKCLACLARKAAFKEAGVVDKTIYQKEIWLKRILKRSKSLLINNFPELYKVIKLVKSFINEKNS